MDILIIILIIVGGVMLTKPELIIVDEIENEYLKKIRENAKMIGGISIGLASYLYYIDNSEEGTSYIDETRWSTDSIDSSIDSSIGSSIGSSNEYAGMELIKKSD